MVNGSKIDEEPMLYISHWGPVMIALHTRATKALAVRVDVWVPVLCSWRGWKRSFDFPLTWIIEQDMLILNMFLKTLYGFFIKSYEN